ncbi:MAG: CAP domain-containing protein [Planctomycetota bacterium]|nr:MAG: CAP domain-containing protein [Planctomycetota bacterium]REJ98539.1 MAG: CAP domain-containing protein [Planctomycetota bacterium]REK29839.1 MAG: CAP domain-containing protein [Planctomycetota bacterium]REK47990.1 MAG: CAP domain-containing protein [Planctomycetota bacterium]
MTCCLLAIVALLPATLARAVELTEAEATLVAKTNEMRARHGLPPLMVSAQLMESARKHAIWMASQGSLTHTSEAVAENIAWGQADATDAVESWMNSSGHRANILNSQYTEIGVAGYFVRGRRIYWCQQFRN